MVERRLPNPCDRVRFSAPLPLYNCFVGSGISLIDLIGIDKILRLDLSRNGGCLATPVLKLLNNCFVNGVGSGAIELQQCITAYCSAIGSFVMTEVNTILMAIVPTTQKERLMKTHLKFQALNLASQARIVRRLLKGNRLPHPDLQIEFQKGREQIKKEGRAVNIVRGFLRGKTMHQIELPHRPYNEGHVSSKGLTRTSPDWDLIEELLKEHGTRYYDSPQEMLQRFAEFKDAAFVHDACAV